MRYCTKSLCWRNFGETLYANVADSLRVCDNLHTFSYSIVQLDEGRRILATGVHFPIRLR